MAEDWTRWRGCARRFFGRRVHDPNAVEDLVQEACVRAWISQRDGRVERMATAWLLGISWRLLADHRREEQGGRASRKRRFVAWNPEELVAWTRERRMTLADRSYPMSSVLLVLDQCVDELPASCRQLMQGRMNGTTMKELARIHGVTLGVVKLRLHRGRRKLRQAILERLREEEDVVRWK